jgi:3-hydroxybutyrate dehydrogenase
LETARTAITCNAICPGWVLTPLVEKRIEANAKRDRVSLNESRQRLLAESRPRKSSRRADPGRGASGGWTAQ